MDSIVHALKVEYHHGKKLSRADFINAANRFCRLYPTSAREMGGFSAVITEISRRVRAKQ